MLIITLCVLLLTFWRALFLRRINTVNTLPDGRERLIRPTVSLISEVHQAREEKIAMSMVETAPSKIQVRN